MRWIRPAGETMLRPAEEADLDLVALLNEHLEKEKARQRFEAGDQTVILNCVFWSMLWGVVPPRWLRDAFCDRAGCPWKFEKWDDAFGPPMPKGTKKAARQAMGNQRRLLIKIAILRKKGVKGDDLFRRAAKELGIARDWKTVRDAYYRIPKSSREFGKTLYKDALAEERAVA